MMSNDVIKMMSKTTITRPTLHELDTAFDEELHFACCLTFNHKLVK